MTALSILDLVNVPEGRSYKDAFDASVELAQKAESWGYQRYWMAEHHNLEGVASSATAVLLSHIGAHTKTIRLGSGGIMLPNHAPLMVAEAFGTLRHLYGDRIDLGLGRAPGTDPLTSQLLRRSHGEDFPEQLAELSFFLEPSEPGQKVRAIPGEGTRLPIWILGSSLASAQLAAQEGRPYAFAGHFAPQFLEEAVSLYRELFRPSAVLSQPQLMVGLSVMIAETDAEAEFLASTAYQRFLSLIRGQLRPPLPPVKDMNSIWSPAEERAVRGMMRYMAVGSPATVARKLRETLRLTRADELIVTCDPFDPNVRLRSYEMLAELGRKGELNLTR